MDHKWEEYIEKRGPKQVKTKGTPNSLINKVIPHHSSQLNIMPPSLIIKSKIISFYPNCPKDNALNMDHNELNLLNLLGSILLKRDYTRLKGL